MGEKPSWKNFFVALGIIIIIFSYPVIVWSTKLEKTITVTRMQRNAESDGGCYMIWTKEGEVFEDTDSYLFLKFNSSDVYGQMFEGKKYRVSISGWRWHWPTSYRNILKVIEKVQK